MAQYNLPAARAPLDRKIAHLRATKAPFRLTRRRPSSPWVTVAEGCAGNACPFGGCTGCGWTS